MQTVLTYLTLLLTGMLLHAQSNSIEVNMTGFDTNDGTVVVGLYDNKDSFLDSAHLYIKSKIDNKESMVTFKDVPDGVYAISCYHDVDDNGKLDMFMGIYPKEPYGTSNNAPARFGPPKWEDARFEVKNGEIATFDIQL